MALLGSSCAHDHSVLRHAAEGNPMKLRKTAAVAAGMFVALGAAAPAMADSGASGEAAGSPGVMSGNVVQVPVDIPVNACGNTVNVVGLLNPASGNACSNGGVLPGRGTTTGTQSVPAADCGCTTTGTQTAPAPEEPQAPATILQNDALADCLSHVLAGQ